MSTLEIIVEDLKTLSPPTLDHAAALIHGLREKARVDLIVALERSAAILSAEEGLMLEHVIAEGCGKIDARDW